MSTHQATKLHPEPAKNRRSAMRLLRRMPCDIAESAELQLQNGSNNSLGITGFTHDISSQGLGLVIPSIEATNLERLKRIEREDLLRITFKTSIGTLEVHARPVRVGPDAEGTTYLLAARIMSVSNPKLYQQILDDYGVDADLSLACVHKLFEAQVKRTPRHTAVVFESEQLTFDQLNRRANQLAHLLRQRGVGPDVLVGILMERSLEMIIGLLAILKAGGAYVPLDPSYPNERISFMLEDTRLSIVLSQQHLRKKLSSQIAEIIHVDMEEKEIRDEDSADVDCEVAPDNLAYVMYTSGSTGKPKGVMIQHSAVCNYLSWMLEIFPLEETDKVLQKAPFTFDVSVWEFYLPLISGAQLIMARPRGERDNNYLISLIAKEGITTIQFVPSLLRLFLAERRLENCHSLKRVISGGEALTATIQKSFFTHLPAVSFYNLYGPTETTVYSTCCRLDPEEQTVSIGKPIKNTEIYLLDQNLQLSPPGASGEIHIGGAGLARGYLNRPELTAEKLIINPLCDRSEERLYKTGDLARYLPDGNLEFLGRVDQQVKIRGMRIELGEIETVLSGNSHVEDSVLVVKDLAPGEKQLVAYVVPYAVTTPTTTELRAYLKERLPDSMLPSLWVLLDAMPLTPNGKIDRNALPSPSHQRPPLAQAYIEPRNETEIQVTKICEELLKIQPIGVLDSFFELGGDSLLATQLLIRIEEEFARTIPPSALIEEATIEYLAKIIITPTDGREYSSLVRMQPKGTKPPIFFVHPLGGEVFGYRSLARHLGEDQPFYGLRARGLDGQLEPYTDIRPMAAGYIAEMFNVQGQGPFLLGGYSSGGIIAFEMAQQLQAQGHQVAFLAVLDEEAPGADQSSWDLGFAIRFLRGLPYWFVDHVITRPFMEVAVDVQRHLRKIAKKTIKAVLKARTHEAFEMGVSDELNLADLSEHGLRVAEATFEALTNYRPRTYQGRITLYRARAEPLFCSHTTDKGWGRLTSGGIDVIFVPGNHLNLYEEPNAASLAREFEKALDRCGKGVIQRSRKLDLCILFTASVLDSVPGMLM